MMVGVPHIGIGQPSFRPSPDTHFYRPTASRGSHRPDDGGGDDDDEDLQANLDYDFARGAELENSLLRLRHQWELKDQKRREEVERQEKEEEERASVSASASSSVGAKRKRSGADGVKKGHQKQGAHQIFSSAEATRVSKADVGLDVLAHPHHFPAVLVS